ncbi:MAG: prepilin-type N-terminal cleavage/methylation domain-containing protein [Phycisphaeraceae bacterium]|nr:prepilin-type N-terminal cleavage/methylation domain-containing protein [Phycisphaeraceae bacterium]
MARGVRARVGFTLLECLLAIAIVSGVLIALLAMRSASIRDRNELAAMQRMDREAEALFQMFVTGAVETPDVDRERRTITYSGAYLGNAYRAVREVREVANPVRRGGGDEGLAATVPVYAYTLTYRGKVYEFDWIR